MDMSVLAVDPPPSLPWLFLFLAVWPLLALYFSRRHADTRLLMLLPISVSAAATAFALSRVAQTLSLTGSAPHATAAGLAEGLVPIVAGCTFALLTLALVGYRRLVHIPLRRRMPALRLLVLTLLTESALLVYLAADSTAFSSFLVRTAMCITGLAVVTAIIVAAQISVGGEAAGQVVAGRSCVPFAVGSAALAATVVIIINKFASFARGL